MPRRKKSNYIKNLKGKPIKEKDLKKGNTCSSCEEICTDQLENLPLNAMKIIETNVSDTLCKSVRDQSVLYINKINIKPPVLASCHQGNARFGRFSGTQCVCMSAMSVLFSKIKALDKWNCADLDRVLIAGNELYVSLQSLSLVNNRYILVSELPSKLEQFGQMFDLDISQESYAGLLWSTYPNATDNIVMNLYEALQTCLLSHDSCFVTFGSNTFAVIKHFNTFFIFDSHSRNKRGLLSENGTCILLHVADIMEVFQHCTELAMSMNQGPGTQFEITGININILTDNSTSNESEHAKKFIINLDDNDLSLRNFNNDVILSHVESHTFTFSPLSFVTKNRIGKQIGIHVPISVNEQFFSVCPLTQPLDVRPIYGDGNCLFRSLSYAIAGTENHHRKVRLSIVQHLQENSALFKQYLRPGYASIQEYIVKERMNDLNTWGTELELFAAANLFQIDIYTYSNRNWLKFPGSHSKEENSLLNEAIYINHLNEMHYEIVVDVVRYINNIDADHTSDIGIIQHEIVNKRKKKKRGHGWNSKRKTNIKCKIPNDLHEIPDIINDTQSLDESNNVLHENISLRISEVTPRKRKKSYNWKSMKNSKRVNFKKEPEDDCKSQSDEKKVDSKEKYHRDIVYRNNIKKQSMNKYRTQLDFRLSVKCYSKLKYKMSENHRKNVKRLSTNKYKTDSNHREKVKHYSAEQYKTDLHHRDAVKSFSTEKYKNNLNHRNKVKRLSINKYKIDLNHKNKIIQQNKDRKLKKDREMSDIERVTEEFNKEKSNGPEYICCVCHRLLFKNQIKSCNMEMYKSKGYLVKKVAIQCITRTYLHECTNDCRSDCNYPESYKSLWICYTCQSKMLSGKIPPESVKNNLDAGFIPKELDSLNSLEKHLVALNIPFMKMVNLGKTKQCKVGGETVCIPNNINEVTKVLPRNESSDQLIRLKLKKRITHKGHYQYELVSKKKLRDALHYLKENNQYYTEIEYDENWNFEHENNDPVVQGMGDNPEIQCFTSDKEMNEEDTDSLPDLDEITVHGPPLDTCLQSVDLAQDVVDQYDSIFSISPAENNKPVKILTDKGNEAMCFPTLFPTGKNTFSDNRDERITLGRYLHCRLMNADNRFARNTDYIFYAQYMYELSQVISGISIALRKGKANGNKITSEMLTTEDPLKNILKSDQGYHFLNSVRGSPSYWKSTQSDLFAMLRQLGIPSFFLSLSAAENRWKHIIETILKQQGDNREAKDLDWAEKNEILRSNPITTARMFDHRFHFFLKNFIMSKAEPIGKVKDYFYRIEFQLRGSPHVHALIWIENAPILGKDPDNKVVEFVDKYITCKMPNRLDDEELHEIVSNVQMHSKKHSNSCRKKNTVCRFNFPRPPSKETFVCRSVDMRENEGEPSSIDDLTNDQAKSVLESMWKSLSDSEKSYNSIDELYTELGMTQELFVKACEKLTKKNYLVLKRDPSDVWINQYNPDLLRAWDANMDIQYVFDAYSCIVYIVSYISKSEREIGLLLAQAHKESVDGNLDAKSSLKKISTTYLHSREVSAQEAAFRVCSLRLKESSRKVVFIPTGPNNIRLTLPLSVLKNRAQAKTLTDENMYLTSIVDRYRARPDSSQFNNMCIAQFCSEYRVMAKSEKIDVDRQRNPAYKLKNELGYVIKRTRTSPAVIRYAKFSITKNPEIFHQSSLQLFLPYRTTEQLKPPQFETYEDFYKSGSVRFCGDIELVREIVNTNRDKYEKDAMNIEMAQELLEKCGPLEDAWANICAETEVDRLECIESQANNTNEDDDPVDIPDLLGNKTGDRKDRQKEPFASVISHAQAVPLMRSLNEIQSKVFYKVRQFCIDKIHKKNPEQFMVFLTGGAGSGKSHIVKSIYYEASRLLARISENPDDVTVTITASTGVAAYNVSGTTLHNLLSIGLQKSLPYQPLSSDKINTLRCKLGNLQILIIDEISMVDHKLLCYIHGRLRQIKQTPDHVPFGNVSIIAVGDFYQLPPVKGRALYNDNEIINLWEDNFKIVQLTEIMRQRDDLTFAQALNRVRTKKKSDQMSVDDINLFSSRETGEEIDAMHIFSTNAQVNEHNLLLIQSKCPDNITIEANDYSKDARTGKMKQLDKYLTRNVDSCLPNVLVIGINARVMLIKNLDVTDGLTNGSFGKVTYITMSNDNKAKIIYVRFDNERVGAILRKESSKLIDVIPEGSTPIEIEEERVNYRGDIRRQFPLKLSYACTIHKVQGLTVDRAVVGMKKIFAFGQAYVALSRVTSLNGLVVRDFDENVIFCDPKIENSIKNMPLYLEPNIEIRRHTEIILFNVEGLMQHYEDIKHDYRFMQADFICLTETWISQLAECRNFGLDGYTLYNQPRHASYDNSNEFEKLKAMKNGGVAVYYANNRQCTIHTLGTFNFEHLAFKVPDIDLMVIVVYRPPCYRAGLFIENLQILLTELNEYGGDVIVIGDFNQDVTDGNSAIEKCMLDNGFTQIIDFKTTTSGTILDLVFCKFIDRSKIHLKLVPTYYSYHECISIGLDAS